MTLTATVSMAEPRLPAAAMMRRMLASSIALAHAAWLVAIFLGYILQGPAGAGNAAVGGAIVVFFYAAGQGIQLLASVLDPRQGMALTVSSFLTRASLLGLLLVVAGHYPRLEALLRPASLLLGVALVLGAWLFGMFWSWQHTRVPAYDQHWDPRPLRRRTRAGRRRPDTHDRGGSVG